LRFFNTGGSENEKDAIGNIGDLDVCDAVLYGM